MRLFVALPLPDTIRFQLSLLCSGIPDTRWVPPENLHISLRFIGEVDGGMFDDIDAALAVIRAPAFTLELTGVGHFGNGARPRALWAGVARQPALQHLRDKVESAVVRTGLEPEGQKFKPHVTLSRLKSVPISKLQDFLVRNSLFRTPPFEVTHFTLYSSFLGHEAASYRPERIYELDQRMAAAS
jgi:2'-5' RNA ligase